MVTLCEYLGDIRKWSNKASDAESNGDQVGHPATSFVERLFNKFLQRHTHYFHRRKLKNKWIIKVNTMET